MIPIRLRRHWAGIVVRTLSVLGRALWLVPLGWLRALGGGVAPRHTLFIHSLVPWDEVWQRPQETALRLARDRSVIFFCPVQAHRLFDSLSNWRAEKEAGEGEAIVSVVTPLLIPGEFKCRLARWINGLITRAEARRLVGQGEGVTLLVNSPFAQPLRARGFRWRAVVYDVIDDFAAFEWAPAQAARDHERLLREADGVIAGTYALLRQIRPARPETPYVASGVRFERFYRPDRDSVTPPPELAAMNGPLVGYVGSISERLDRDLIAEAARRYPKAHFVFIGPIHGSFGEPPAAANLHFLGPRPHVALADYMNRFDLAIMPFRITPATLAINPIKTLEYLASGCIVLSVAIPDVIRFYSDVVAIADSPAEFLDQIGALLSADNEARWRRGLERARAASWDDTAVGMARAIRRAEETARRRRESE